MLYLMGYLFQLLQHQLFYLFFIGETEISYWFPVMVMFLLYKTMAMISFHIVLNRRWVSQIKSYDLPILCQVRMPSSCIVLCYESFHLHLLYLGNEASHGDVKDEPSIVVLRSFQWHFDCISYWTIPKTPFIPFSLLKTFLEICW